MCWMCLDMGRISYTFNSMWNHFLLNFDNFGKQLNLWLTAEFQHARIFGALHFEARSLSAVLIVKYYVPVIRTEKEAGLAERRNPAPFSSTCSGTDEGGREASDGPVDSSMLSLGLRQLLDLLDNSKFLACLKKWTASNACHQNTSHNMLSSDTHGRE